MENLELDCLIALTAFLHFIYLNDLAEIAQMVERRSRKA